MIRQLTIVIAASLSAHAYPAETAPPTPDEVLLVQRALLGDSLQAGERELIEYLNENPDRDYVRFGLGPMHDDFESRITHGFTDNNGVRIHHASIGEGPLLVMLHGFPDFWYTWREQMEALSSEYRCVAIDLRGYNLSDKPEGVENYAMPLLISDVAAVIRDFGAEQAIICGHDWGGAIAWSVAMYRPDLVERLIILNLPHPAGLMREFATNREQQENSQYARNFQQEGAHESLTAEGLAAWVTDDSAREKYIEAFERSDFEAMLNYYKANYPRNTAPRDDADGDTDGTALAQPTPAFSGPRVACSILMMHGLDDKALLAAGLNDTWEFVDGDLTIVTIPGAGHFVQQDASDLVTRSMRAWLNR